MVLFLLFLEVSAGGEATPQAVAVQDQRPIHLPNNTTTIQRSILRWLGLSDHCIDPVPINVVSPRYPTRSPTPPPPTASPSTAYPSFPPTSVFPTFAPQEPSPTGPPTNPPTLTPSVSPTPLPSNAPSPAPSASDIVETGQRKEQRGDTLQEKEEPLATASSTLTNSSGVRVPTAVILGLGSGLILALALWTQRRNLFRNENKNADLGSGGYLQVQDDYYFEDSDVSSLDGVGV